MRILLGLAAQLDRLVADDVDRHLALLHDDQVVNWLERQHPLLVVERLVVITVIERSLRRARGAYVTVILIERQRQRQFIDHSARRSLSVGAPVMDERLSENASLPGVRVRIAWFERQRALEQP